MHRRQRIVGRSKRQGRQAILIDLLENCAVERQPIELLLLPLGRMVYRCTSSGLGHPEQKFKI